jgi:hypothetical protein
MTLIGNRLAPSVALGALDADAKTLRMRMAPDIFAGRFVWPSTGSDWQRAAMKTCPKCGKPTSIWTSSLIAGVCQDCSEAEAKARDEEKIRTATEHSMQEARRQQQAAVERAEAERLLASAADDNAGAIPFNSSWFEERGFLLAAGKLIECPICHHDRFWQQKTLMNTRVATFFNFDWANRGADTRICRQCGHVMWFAR